MPAPNHQIARPRKRDSLKPFYSYVEIGGTRVVVGKPGSFVNGVNEMRTIMLGIPPFGIQRGSNYRQPIVWTERPIGLSLEISIRVLAYGA
ncbi:MAG: hypothetical protein WBV36_21975 [Terriglobales bacterium]